MNIELVVWGHIRYNDKIVGGYHNISMQMCVMSTAHLTMLTYWRERDIFLKVSACELLGRIIRSCKYKDLKFILFINTLCLGT